VAEEPHLIRCGDVAAALAAERQLAPASRADVEHGVPSTVAKHLEGVGGEHEVQMVMVSRLLACGERAARYGIEEAVLGALVARQPRDLGHAGRRRRPVEVTAKRGMRVDGARLADRAERASLGDEQVRLAEELAARREAAARPSGALGDGPLLRAVDARGGSG